MDIKKILGLTILILALFVCMSIASAGWFGPSNETHEFDGFSFDFPEGTTIKSFSDSAKDYDSPRYVEGNSRSNFTWSDFNDNYDTETYTVYLDDIVTIVVLSGDDLVPSIDEYVDNWVEDGGLYKGEYGQWVIIDVQKVPQSYSAPKSLNLKGYVLARYDGDKIISIYSENLTLIKNIADTNKPISN